MSDAKSPPFQKGHPFSAGFRKNPEANRRGGKAAGAIHARKIIYKQWRAKAAAGKWRSLCRAGVRALPLLLVATFAHPVQAGTIPPFRLIVPSREHSCSDTTTTDIDFDRTTIVVEARSWRSYILTFENIPRDSAVTVGFTAGAGWYRVSWRVSEPGIIGCWSSPVGMIAMGY